MIKDNEIFEDEIIEAKLPSSFISALISYLLCIGESVQAGSHLQFKLWCTTC